MSDIIPADFYRSKIAQIARRDMPVADAVIFLRGALDCAAASVDMEEIMCAYRHLVVGDDHLEIASGQLRLPFGKDGKDGHAQ